MVETLFPLGTPHRVFRFRFHPLSFSPAFCYLLVAHAIGVSIEMRELAVQFRTFESTLGFFFPVSSRFRKIEGVRKGRGLVLYITWSQWYPQPPETGPAKLYESRPTNFKRVPRLDRTPICLIRRVAEEFACRTPSSPDAKRCPSKCVGLGL